ncbi:LuxR C-terminal-related transcriptional regulator [Riemerella anatipestifer]|nr:LuxR C-terminal-related transcriptional regulator [Riemerella anatipestifer]
MKKASTNELFIGNTAKRVYLSKDKWLKNPKEDCLKFGFVFSSVDENENQVFLNTSIESRLSEREMQVYNNKEKSNLEIAEMLGVSEKTIECYRDNIKRKGF